MTVKSLNQDVGRMKMQDRNNNKIKSSYDQSKIRGLKSNNYLKRMMSEKESKKNKIEQIQIQKFMNKFCVLSDYNMCIGSNHLDPDHEELKLQKTKTMFS